MNNSMPYSLPEEGQEDVSYFHHVDAGSLRSNVIIHEARNVFHAVIYCVSFLDEYAQPAHGSCWISADVMNSVITHTKRKLKYVYDETIVSKPGWVQRQKDDCHTASNGDVLSGNKDNEDDENVAVGCNYAAAESKSPVLDGWNESYSSASSHK